MIQFIRCVLLHIKHIGQWCRAATVILERKVSISWSCGRNPWKEIYHLLKIKSYKHYRVCTNQARTVFMLFIKHSVVHYHRIKISFPTKYNIFLKQPLRVIVCVYLKVCVFFSFLNKTRLQGCCTKKKEAQAKNKGIVKVFLSNLQREFESNNKHTVATFQITSRK